MSFGIPEGNYYNTAKNFDNWTNSSDNYNKALEGEQVEEFSMFDSKNLGTYSSDLKQFSQEYIDMWDADGDGSWSKEEFITMSTAGEGIPETIPEETQKAYAELFDALYENLNLDNNKESISASEFASYLYAADMDWEKYAETGSVADSVDGKLDYVAYQGLSSIMEGDAGYEQLQAEKADFYNYFYKDDEAKAAEATDTAKSDEVAKADETSKTDETAKVDDSEKEVKEVKSKKADLQEGYTISDNKEIMDKTGKVIGRIDVSYADVTNDGKKDKITEYYLFQ